jgi:hypothetical protein
MNRNNAELKRIVFDGPYRYHWKRLQPISKGFICEQVEIYICVLGDNAWRGNLFTGSV